jgi:hypothetical protein
VRLQGFGRDPQLHQADLPCSPKESRMIVALIVAGAIIAPAVVFAVGYETGRFHAESARRRFVQSLIPGGEHSDLVEDEEPAIGNRRVRVRRGVRGRVVHEEGIGR